FVFVLCRGHHRDALSFPTRRSSDLLCVRGRGSRRSSLRQVLENTQTFCTFYCGARIVALRESLEVGCCGFDRPSHRLFERSLGLDRRSTRLNSSHVKISYAVFCLKE